MHKQVDHGWLGRRADAASGAGSRRRGAGGCAAAAEHEGPQLREARLRAALYLEVLSLPVQLQQLLHAALGSHLARVAILQRCDRCRQLRRPSQRHTQLCAGCAPGLLRSCSC